MLFQQLRDMRRIALDDLRPGKAAAQEGCEFGVALDHGKPRRRNARGQQGLGDFPGPGAQFDHVSGPSLQRVHCRPRHGFGQQTAARHHGSHRERPAQPASQEKSSTGA